MIVCRVRVTEPPVQPAIGVASPRGSSGRESSLTTRMMSVLLVSSGGLLGLSQDVAKEPQAASRKLHHVRLTVGATGLNGLGPPHGAGDTNDRAPRRRARSPARWPCQTRLGDAPGRAQALAHRLGDRTNHLGSGAAVIGKEL